MGYNWIIWAVMDTTGRYYILRDVKGMLRDIVRLYGRHGIRKLILDIKVKKGRYVELF